MKLSSLIVAATMVATVEGKHKKDGAKASKNYGTGGGTSFVGFGGKASKGAKGGGALFAGSDNNWWSPTKDKFDVCAVADPVGNQIEILGDQSPGLEHASWVYSGFADAVKGYNSGALSNDALVNLGRDVVGDEPDAPHKGVPVNVQCVMMRAMIQQMKDSCYYDSSRGTYVPVAALLMSGFNDASNDPKDNFVLYCVASGLVERWVEDYLG